MDMDYYAPLYGALIESMSLLLLISCPPTNSPPHERDDDHNSPTNKFKWPTHKRFIVGGTLLRILAAIHIPVTPWQSTKTTKTGQQCILSNTTPTHRNHHLVYDSSSVLWSLVLLFFFFFLAGWRLVPFSVYCLANWQWFVVARPCWTNWLETDATPTIQSNYSWC